MSQTRNVTPIFLLSLPRSGSTLAQRILGAHPSIATTSEPWLLLPLLYARYPSGVSAEYGHQWAAQGISDFAEAAPNGRDQFNTAVREFALRLYERTSFGKDHFLDKTPRYHLIVDDLIDVFPDAKYIVLWRNPLAIAASMITSFTRDGHWNLAKHRIDLYRGLENLIAATKRTDVQMHTVRFEDMVEDPESVWQGVFSYLELPFEASVLNDFTEVPLRGRMGDPTRARYATISKEPIARWPSTFSNPLRRRWARRYVHWLGPDRLEYLGYNPEQLLDELAAAPWSVHKLAQDLWYYPLGAANTLLDLAGLRRRLDTLLKGGRLYGQD